MATVVESGSGDVCNDQDAAACLAQGNPKSKLVPVKWGMKDRDGNAGGLAKPGSHDPYAGAKAS
jgi:hypothetical protein